MTDLLDEFKRLERRIRILEMAVDTRVKPVYIMRCVDETKKAVSSRDRSVLYRYLRDRCHFSCNLAGSLAQAISKGDL